MSLSPCPIHRRPIQKALTLGVLCLGAALLPVMRAYALDAGALPSGGVVAGGSAGFDYSVPNELHINQSSDRVVINWDSFNIGENASTQFHQNSSSSLAVNRVTGAHIDPTMILGTLKANGRVIVLDRNGVIFGSHSIVDVGGIIASTGNIDDNSFMRGDDILKIDHADSGAIVMNGSMSVADAGLAAFVAPSVINNGIISAKLGRVELAGASSATLDLYGDGLTEVTIDRDEGKTLVANNGIITAEGGTVVMTAAAAKKIVDATVNMTGIISVGSVNTRGGKIVLSAQGRHAVKGNIAADKDIKSGSGKVYVSGYLDASGYGNHQHGGDITITGDTVAILKGSLLDTSGDAGGGNIKIGGDYLGSGTTEASLLTYVDQNALILNNAVSSGNGGRTIIWSDGDTGFYGSVFARGGQISGDGGFVETSGHHTLDALGYVDLTASHGDKGTYLLDPTDIAIYGNVDPGFVSTDGNINLASSLKLWLDASDSSHIVLTYNSIPTTASGTNGTNMLTVGSNAGLAVGARVRLGAAGSVTTADNTGADTYTIAGISGSTITLTGNLTSDYAGSAVYQGYVSQVTDKSSSNANAIQTTAGEMPLWISNRPNGSGVMMFDGMNDNLSLSSYSIPYETGVFAVNRTNNNNGTVIGDYAGSGSNKAYSWHGGRLIDTTQFGGFYSAGESWLVNGVSTNMASGTDFYSLIANRSDQQIFSGASFKVGVDFTSFDYLQGNIGEIALYNAPLSTMNMDLLNQYQSAKFGIELAPPGTGPNEASKAMAADGYSVFTSGYLERLSQTANIVLQASHDIKLDLKGGTVDLAGNRDITLNAGHDIISVSNGAVKTNGMGNLLFNAANGIQLNNNIVFEGAGTGNLTFDAGHMISVPSPNNFTTHGAAKTIFRENGVVTYDSSYVPPPPSTPAVSPSVAASIDTVSHAANNFIAPVISVASFNTLVSPPLSVTYSDTPADSSDQKKAKMASDAPRFGDFKIFLKKNGAG